MSRAKTFTAGQAVEIQREPGAAWESATYDRPRPGSPGYHIANLPGTAPPRLIKMPASVRMADVAVHWVNVPAQRIRASKAKP